MVVVLMVAEKPSLAKSLAEILSRKTCSRRKSSCSACDVYEFDGKLQLPPPPRGGGRPPSFPAHFKMTSVCGHVTSLDFLPKYNNWDTTDPVKLYEAETIKKEAVPSLRIPSFLRHEGKGVDYLVLWLDCDKEGENICFEVIHEVEPLMRPPRSRDTQTILRARFSAITESAIFQAFHNLGLPNLNESLSVDARQEVDLRVGCSFTRFQTKMFQSLYSGLSNSVVSYGPCQTPTLGFCVQRHDEIQQFKPKKYWRLDCKVVLSRTALDLTWDKERIFDREIVKGFHSKLQDKKTASVESVSEKSRSKAPPTALHTVELLKGCSSRLHVSPKQAMDIAERLYTEGYISYPRTETTQYPASFDFHSIVSDLNKNEYFREYTSQILSGPIRAPKGGKDIGDHPPITPLKNVSRGDLSDIQWKVYEMVTSHFIASLLPECKYKSTEVRFSIGGESFHWSGNTLIDPGFTTVHTWQAISRTPGTSVEFVKGQKWDVAQLSISEHLTTPPGYLTESELISLMEKHGIGTDASIPVHIENICTRNYVHIQAGARKLVPTQLGIVLVHGYQKIDPELVQPTMRSAIEKQLNQIALGKADYDRVLDQTLDTFRKKFCRFRDNISEMNELFEATFSTVASTAKPLSRCGKCLRYMTFIPARPQRLHCKHCDETYSLPQNGSVKLYKEIKCPLDGFEIVLFSGPRGKSFTVCPYCYSNPPFPTVTKGMTCAHCPHETCPQAMNQLVIDNCTKCDTGSILLDPSSGPKWKLYCNNMSCSLIIHCFDGVHNVEKTNTECECGAFQLLVDFKKDKSPLSGGATKHIGCYQCDPVLSPFVRHPESGGRGGYRGRGRGRGRRGRGRGRGGRRHHH